MARNAKKPAAKPRRISRPLTVYLPPDLYAAVESAAAAEGRRVAQMARRLIEKSLTPARDTTAAR